MTRYGQLRSTPLLQRRVLDEQAAWSRRYDPAPWGAWPWLGPVLVLVAVIVSGQSLAHLLPSGGDAALVAALLVTAAAYGLLVVAVWRFGHRVLARPGGWRLGLGLMPVTRSAWLPWIIGVGAVFVGRIVVGVLANALTQGQAVREAQNIHVSNPTIGKAVVLTVLVVGIAPVVEELMFRGLLLRTFMRRLSFWPAAALSTALFAAFHVYEVSTVVGAITLAAGIAVLGLTNCYLVRITGSLTPGIMVHATFNLPAAILIIYQATH